mgnify:CR=1
MVRFPHRQGSLTYVNVATFATSKRTSRADGVCVKAALDDVHGINVPQKEPYLNHVAGFPVIGFKSCDDNKGKAVVGPPFVNNVTFWFSHNVYWLTDWLSLLVEPWRYALAPKNPASHYEQAG